MTDAPSPHRSAADAPRPPVTLADVAAAAGVGESTVSRVLRNHGSFSPKTREKVMAAVEALGYLPNRIAGTLASAGSALVGIVVPSLANIVFPDLLRGATAELEAAGLQSVIAVSDYDPAREAAHVSAMLAWRPAALIIAGLEHAPQVRARLTAGSARVVEVLDLDGEGMDLVVGFSNREIGRTAARHLLSRGYRRLGYVGHDVSGDTRAGKRFSAFVRTVAEAGGVAPECEMMASSTSVEAGREGLERLLARAPQVDAVYFSNDDMAIGGYFLCLARGIAVPERLALFGHNGLDIGRMAPQPLTTILTPRVAVGASAARLVAQNAPAQRLDLGFQLIEGATA